MSGRPVPSPQGRDEGDGRMASVGGRPASGVRPVGGYWQSKQPEGVMATERGVAESELRGVDATRRMVYDDLLMSNARRGHGGMELGQLNDARKQYYENHRACRLDLEREKDRSWEHEKWVHSERMIESSRDQERMQQREHEWEQVFKAEQDRQHEVDRRFEEEKHLLRDDWEQEKRFEREKEQQRAREWEQVRDAERRRMRQKMDEFKDECAKERRQWAERQLQWEAEKQRYIDDWKDDDGQERAAWERWYQQLKEEHELRKKRWDSERAELRREYLAIDGSPQPDRSRRSAPASTRGAPSARSEARESIQHEDRPSPEAVRDALLWLQRCQKKIEGPPAVSHEIESAFWLFVRNDADGDGVLESADLETLASTIGMDGGGGDILSAVGPSPFLGADRFIEWFGQKEDGVRVGVSLELERHLQGGEAASLCRAMTEDEIRDHLSASTDAKLEAGVKVWRRAWSTIGALREREQESAALAQEKAGMEAAIADDDGRKLIEELEASQDYTDSGFSRGELEGILETYFQEASRGLPEISFTDGTFDRMLARLRVDDFTPQERAITERVWGSTMDFSKFTAWLSTRKPPDRKALAIGEILLS
eukprot:Hpha_TRINITY_DN9628_c0_g1::TRINITY_DN9628_c0_g1_i1::g.184515::m.184515